MPSSTDPTETERLLHRVSQGDRSALDQLVDLHRGYLCRLIDLRMEDELRGRVDPSDVVQETQMVVSRRIDDFLDRRPTTFRLWIRRKALERLIDLRRRHLAAKRSVRREVPWSDASSEAVAENLLRVRPSEVLRREQLALQVREAIQGLSEVDREVLLLRHVEELTNAEVAELLGIEPATASKRYGRAVRRLSQKLAELGISRT